MMKRNMTAFCFLIFTGLMGTGTAALAQDSELEFVSTVVAVSGEGRIITIRISGIDVDVDITDDTEIDIKGDSFPLTGLSAGDSVEIEGFFAPGGRIIAEELSILDRRQQEFSYRGEVSDLDFDAVAPDVSDDPVARMELLGSDVYINEDARIILRGARAERGRSEQSTFSDLSTHLNVGDTVSARGTYDGTARWVSDLRIGDRNNGEIEVEGQVQSLLDDGFVIRIKDAGDFVILIDEFSEVDGAIRVGASVEVEGMLTEDAALLAFEVDTDANDEDDEDEDDEDDDDEDEDEDEDDDGTDE